MHANPLDTKRSANRLLLLICVAFLLCNLFVPSLLIHLNPNLYLLLVTVLAEGVLFLPAWLFMRGRGGPAAFGLRLPGNRAQVLWGLGLGVAGFLLATGINSAMQALWMLLGVTTLDTSASAYTGGGWNILISFLCIVAIPVLAEETLFRGTLLHSWLPQNRTMAVWRTALLFSLMHMNPMSLPAYLALGLLMASVTVLSGSILPAMLVHGVNNLFVLLISLASTPAFVAEAEVMMQPGEFFFAATIYLLLGAVVGRFCHRRFRTAVARQESTRRLFRLPERFDSEHSIFLPPPPPEAEESTEEGMMEAAVEDAAPQQVPAAVPLEATQLDLLEAPLQNGAPQDASAEATETPPRRARLLGTGRVSLLAAYILLILANLFVFLLAAGFLGALV